MGALRVAVVGVGQLGRHHARLLASLPDVELVGVFDLNRQRAEEIAAGVKTSCWSIWRRCRVRWMP